MGLLGTFFELVSSRETEDGFEATVRTLPDSEVFRAHFPGWPVTPGAVQIRMATELLGLRSGRTPGLCGVDGLKFLSPVLPGEELVFKFKGEDVVVVRDGSVVSRMTLRYL